MDQASINISKCYYDTNATTQIPGFSSDDHATAFSNLGIPLTGSTAMGFAVGFIKG